MLAAACLQRYGPSQRLATTQPRPGALAGGRALGLAPRRVQLQPAAAPRHDLALSGEWPGSWCVARIAALCACAQLPSRVNADRAVPDTLMPSCSQGRLALRLPLHAPLPCLCCSPCASTLRLRRRAAA